MLAMKRDEEDAADGRPTRERVYLYVREQILRGRYPGGAFIEEGDIAAAMGVSRTPVREAFHRLQAERFIDLLPRRGAQVRQVTAQELADLYETRRMIEGYALARICRERITAIEPMRRILAAMDVASDDDHFPRVELNREFHFAMVTAVGNEVLSELYQSLGSRQQRVAMRAITVDPGRIARIRVEHHELLDALEAHDEARARAVLDLHLRPVFGVV